MTENQAKSELDNKRKMQLVSYFQYHLKQSQQVQESNTQQN